MTKLSDALWDYLPDKQFFQGVGNDILATANRGGIASVIGAPVDIANQLTNLGRALYGYAGNKAGVLSAGQMPALIEKPVGGSEWIGDKLQEGGFINGNRNHLAEFLAGMIAPGMGVKGAAGANRLVDAAISNAQTPRTINTPAFKGQRGAVSIPPRADAFRIAQENAAKPVSEGGLGLPSDNTPMQRADAMPEFGMELFRGQSAAEPGVGNWFSRTPSAENQNYEVMLKARGPSTKLVTGGTGKTWGEKFTTDIADLFEREGEKQLAATIRKDIGGQRMELGEVMDYLKRTLGGGQAGEEAALGVFNKLAGTKGFSGGDATGGTVLLHPSTPRRFITAAFDPAKRSSLDPLASFGLLGLGSVLGTGLYDQERGQ